MHLDEDTIVALFRGELPGEELTRVDLHMDDCAECRVLVSNLAGRDAEPVSATVAASALAGLSRAREAAARLSPGTVLGGRFALEQVVGAGGMGEVYRAHDGESGESVAIKVLRADADLSRFEREARLLARLVHPGIVRYVTHGAAPDGTPFLAMQWLDGTDLAERLRTGKLGVDATLRLGARVAEALAAAHAIGVVHRDVKPSNILLPDGDVERAVVVDFGVARGAPSDATNSTRTGMLLGTLGYMAPEQARGAKNADARADVFSLGCVVYECLTGARAFAGADAVEVLAKVLIESPRPAKELAPEVPDALDALVTKMLAKRPEDRPADAVAVAEALRNVAHRPAPPRRRAAIVLGGVALAVLAAVIVGPKLLRPPPPPAPPAPALAPATETAVLVLGIENRTADPILDATLDDALASALGRSKLRLIVYQGHYLRALAEDLGAPRVDESMAKTMEGRDGRKVVTVRGSVASKGAGYALAITAHDTRGAQIVSATREAPDPTRVIATVALLAGDLRTAMGDPPDPKIAEQTSMSQSLEADHEFTVGRGLADSGKYNDAIEHLRRAVAIDPKFCKAHQTLGIFLENTGRNAEASKEFELALASSDTLAEPERLWFLGDYYRDVGDYDKSAAAYIELLAMRPGDVGVEIGLSTAYSLKRDVVKALALGRTAVAEHPKHVIARANLAELELYAGNFAQAEATANGLFTDFPHPTAHTYVYFGATEIVLGKRGAAAAAYEKLRAIDPSLAASSLADLALHEGRVGDAEAILERAIAEDVAKSDREAANVKWAMLAEARLRRADAAGAAAAAAKALEGKAPPTLFAAGQVLVRAGRDAAAVAARLGREPGQEPRMYARLLEAEIRNARGKPKESLDAVEEAQRASDSWLGHLALADAHLDAGAYADAEREFRTCIARRGEGAIVYADDVPTTRYLPRVTYMLARALEGQRSPEARAMYEAFLALQASADRDPLVVDARRRLTALRP